jgi:hypothetical protein
MLNNFPPRKDDISYRDSVEIVIYFDPQELGITGDVDISQAIIHRMSAVHVFYELRHNSPLLIVKHNTRIKHTREEATVLLEGVECTGDSADNPPNTMNTVDVTFQFGTSEGHFPAQTYSSISC